MQRIHSSAEIQSNVSLSNGRLDNMALAKLISHLKSLSKGSYLYLKLTLDLIEGGYLVLKSSSFKVRKVWRRRDERTVGHGGKMQDGWQVKIETYMHTLS